MNNLVRLKSLVLPIAILLGLLLHKWCAYAQFLIPYFIFTILLMSYSAVDVSKLKPSRMDLWLVLFQIIFSVGPYLLLKWLGVHEIIAQGVLITVLCPVAASSVVIACMLGAGRERVTTYTIIGNLMVSIVAPIIFSLIGAHQDMGFINAFLLIFRKIFLVIALPFILAIAGQRWTPRVNSFICRIKEMSFYLWALTLTITLGQTFHYIFLHGRENALSIIILGSASVAICIIQFATGKKIGEMYGDRMAGGQLLGQKNAAMGVWMANTFLLPLASFGIALYSIWQNLFNSWQMLKHKP